MDDLARFCCQKTDCTLYESAIRMTFSQAFEPEPSDRPGRPRLLSERRLPADLAYAAVHKGREHNHVVGVRQTVVLGGREVVERALEVSACSRTIKTSFVERQHVTDQGRNARK